MTAKISHPSESIMQYISVSYETELTHINVTGPILLNLFSRTINKIGVKNQSNPTLKNPKPKE